MSKLIFKATHRILVKANAEGHGYEMVSIDVNNGTFYKELDVDAKDTKIRVKGGIAGEKLGYNGNKDYHTPLKNKTAIKIIGEFNLVRHSLGFKPLEFHRLEK